MDPTTSVTLGIAACAAKGLGGSSGPAWASTTGSRLCAGALPSWLPTAEALPPAVGCGPVDISAPVGGPGVGAAVARPFLWETEAGSRMTRGRGRCWGWLCASSVTAGVGASLCSSSVTSAKAAVNGVLLHYLRAGDGEHAVLLLPGMLGVQVSLAARHAVLCSAPNPGCLGSMRSLSALLRCFL